MERGHKRASERACVRIMRQQQFPGVDAAQSGPVLRLLNHHMGKRHHQAYDSRGIKGGRLKYDTGDALAQEARGATPSWRAGLPRGAPRPVHREGRVE